MPLVNQDKPGLKLYKEVKLALVYPPSFTVGGYSGGTLINDCHKTPNLGRQGVVTLCTQPTYFYSVIIKRMQENISPGTNNQPSVDHVPSIMQRRGPYVG